MIRNCLIAAFPGWLLLGSPFLGADPTSPATPNLLPTSPSDGIERVLQDRERISGLIEADRIIVPDSAVVVASADTELRATEVIEVRGRIVVEDVVDLDQLDGPDLTLNCGLRITIHGSIAGARGRCLSTRPAHVAAGLEGGDGGDITLNAPDILVTGLVAAGDGGYGGPGSDGGNGGWVYQIGRHITDNHAPPTTPLSGESFVARKGGDGGRGGDGTRVLDGLRDGGDGGNAGSVWCELHPDDFDRGDGEQSSGESGGSGNLAPNLLLQIDCDQGVDGTTAPGTNQGGVAADGGHGDPGTPGKPNGGNAGNGGDAPPVTGADPQHGGDAQDCCLPTPGQGKRGGNGGTSGHAVGKKGGDGGDGGNALYDEMAGVYLGNGGDAGDGGDGASVTIKKGGNAGTGGDGNTPGPPGTPGQAGGSTPGAKGEAGKAGIGLTNGAAGTDGASGSNNGGGVGNPGGFGNGCPPS